MTQIPPPFPAPSAPGPTVLVNDLACRKCGYNLRGLSSEGRCPECGSAVGLSIQGDLLRYSNPKWVRTLQRGIRFIIAALVLMVLGFIVSAALAALVGFAALIGIGILALAGYVLIIVGSWFLTEPDPSGVGEDRYGTSRKIIRFTLLAGLAQNVLQIIEMAVNLPPQVRMAFDLVAVVTVLIAIVGIYAQMDYLQKLSLRIPDDTLANRAKFLKVALTGSYAVFLILQTIMQFTGGPARPAAGMAGMACVSGLLGLAVLIFGIMYLLLLEKLGKRFGQEAAAAEQSWARLDVPPAAASRTD